MVETYGNWYTIFFELKCDKFGSPIPASKDRNGCQGEQMSLEDD